jgi:glucokinase-like ROK family protein
MIKSHNLSRTLLMLLRHRSVSRVRLAQMTGLSATTITNLIGELLEQGIVVEDSDERAAKRGRRGVGRPEVALRLAPEARYAVGVHIGVGSVSVAVTGLLAQPLCELTMEHALDRPAREVLAEAAGMVQDAVAQCGIDPQQVVGVGVGASGLVNPATGVNLFAPSLGWRDAPVRDWFHEWVNLPVHVDNNVRAMALSEALFGAGQDVRSLAFVYARVGVGAGIVVDGRLYHGGGAGAGEIGHMIIIPDGGEVCRCGNKGCLETLVSEPVIVRLAEQIARQDRGGLLATYLREVNGPVIERVFTAARDGDAAARAMLEARAHYMGIALANLVNMLNPDLIVLGGILAQAEHLFVPVVRAVVREYAFANLGEAVRLEVSSFGQSAGVVGAAALALDTFFYRPPERVV